ncbi:MAG: hypothetical protein QF662_07910, partial [Phycisphaerae bacterium]|nr:hypothetical protein [Phycisphaerae bacterium]
WKTSISSLPTGIARTATNRKFRAVPTYCLVVDEEGTPVGMSMNSELPLDDSWKGSPMKWPALLAEEMKAMLTALEKACDQGVMRVTLNFRSPKKGSSTAYSSYSGDSREGATERNVSGILIDEKRVLVIANMKPKITARLERITVYLGTGEPVTAKFTSSLRDFGCFIATLEKPLEGAVVFAPEEIIKYHNQLLLSAKVLNQGEKRVTYFLHNRIPSFEIGWKRKIYPEMRGRAENTFLFDEKNRLVAMPIARRQKEAVAERYSSDYAKLTPVAFVTEALGDLPKHIDVNNVPLSEEEENRLAWLGVELQALNRELARANNVSELTKDGEMGAIVSYVYDDSPAKKAGVEPGFILLRLHVEDQPKPIDVKVGEGRYSFEQFPWAQLDKIPEQYYDRIPRPWPSVENRFIRSLTDLGFGKKFSAEFFHDGKSIRKEFVVMQSPPHYDSAPGHKSKMLGLTVR